MIPLQRFLAPIVFATLIFQALIFSLPILAPTHMEAHSMTMLSMAIDFMRGGQNAMHEREPFKQIVSHYLYLSRPGTIHVLASMVRWLGSDNAWTVLIWINFILLAFACTTFAMIWGVKARHAMLAILLCQGLTSTASTFNETLFWITPIVLALTSIPSEMKEGREWMMVATGSTLGFAVLMQTDALFAAPLVAATLFASTQNLKSFMAACGYALLGFSAMLIGLSLGWKISLFEIPNITSIFAETHGEGVHWDSILFVIGIPLLFIIPLGFSAGPSRIFRASMILAALYIFMLSLFVSSSPRHVLPLLFPLIALWGGAGLERLVILLRSSLSIYVFSAFLVVSALSIMKPSVLSSMDGPHYLLGRMNAVGVWLVWQGNMRINQAAMRDFISELPSEPQRTVLITGHPDDDSSLRLRMSEGNWETTWLDGGVGRHCLGGVLHSNLRNGKEILHVRTSAFYGLGGRLRSNDAMMALMTLGCPEILNGSRVFLATSLAQPHHTQPDMWGEALSEWMTREPKLRFRELSSSEVSALISRLEAMTENSKITGSDLRDIYYWQTTR
jgi:hypothetical protein